MKQPQVRLKVDLPPMSTTEAKEIAREMAATLRSRYATAAWAPGDVPLDVRAPKVQMRKRKRQALGKNVVARH